MGMILVGLTTILAFLIVAFIFAIVFIRERFAEQAIINAALANYVAADLQQTWQKSAEELVEAIRGQQKE